MGCRNFWWKEYQDLIKHKKVVDMYLLKLRETISRLGKEQNEVLIL